MQANEIILARGHKNIMATHETTLEVTKEDFLTRKGDCIVAVSANKSLPDLSPSFKNALRQKNARLEILIEAGQIREVINASGNPYLIMTHQADMVIRESEYICDRTLAVKADKAACDLPRKLVAKLRNPAQEVKITLTARV